MYEYFKKQFLQKTESFGREKLAYEKEVLKNVSEKTLIGCKTLCKKHCGKEKLGVIRMKTMDPICEYIYKKELAFLNEIRENQKNKCLQILFDKVVNDARRMELNDVKLNETVKQLQIINST